jgi:phage-related protein
MQISLDTKVERFISSLDKQTIAKVLRTLDLLEEFGHQLGMPHSKNVAKGLFELRTRGRQEVRIFYAFHKGQAYLLQGFIKKSQKTPKKELETAMDKLKGLT